MALRNMRESASFSAGAIIFWVIAGGALAYGLANLMSFPAGATSVATFVGVTLGICFGLYAGLAATRLARILALPGVIFDLLSW